MTAPRRILGVLRALPIVAAMLAGIACAPARAQLFTAGPDYKFAEILNDTVAVAHRDSSTVVDMERARNLTLSVWVYPPSGTAEPWANVAVRCLCSYKKTPDSLSTAVVKLQPTADHSYISTVAGDSLAYGSWSTVGPLELASGEVLVRGQRSSTKYPYPAGQAFTIENKGQTTRCRALYFYARTLATGSGAAARVRMVAQTSN